MKLINKKSKTPWKIIFAPTGNFMFNKLLYANENENEKLQVNSEFGTIPK